MLDPRCNFDFVLLMSLQLCLLVVRRYDLSPNVVTTLCVGNIVTLNIGKAVKTMSRYRQNYMGYFHISFLTETAHFKLTNIKINT